MVVRRRTTVASVAVLLALLGACSGDDDAVVDPATTVSSTTELAPDTTRSTDGDLPADRPTHEVIVFDGEVVDDARDRRIPYRVYAPEDVTGPVPVVLVSHGGVGSETGYQRGGHLGSTFAADGMLAVHVGHVRSTVPRGQVTDRPADVSIVLDRIEDGTLPLPDGFAGTADLGRVGHTGHSFGAYTSHALAGADYGRPSARDPRIDAIVPISPQGAGQFGAFDRGPDDSTWTPVTVPVFSLVGGDEIDSDAVDSIERPGWRLQPFDRYPDAADRILTIVPDQDHSEMWNDGSAEVEAFIAGEIADFFRVYVAGDASVDACTIGGGDLDVDTRRLPSASGSRLQDCTG